VITAEQARVEMAKRELARRDSVRAATVSPVEDSEDNNIGSSIWDIGKQAIAPTVGGAVGTGIGAIFGPAGAYAGEAIGSGLGEGVNQLFGVTPKSLSAIGIEALAPGVLGTAARGAKGLFKLARRGGGLDSLGRAARSGVEREISKFNLPGLPASAHYKTVDEATDLIDLPQGIAEIDRVTSVLKGFSNPPVQLLSYLDNLKTAAAKGMTPGQLQRELHSLGAMVDTAIKTQGMKAHDIGNIKKLFGQDVTASAASGNVGAAALKQARQATRREKGMELLNEGVAKGSKPVRGFGEEEAFNPAALIPQLRTNPKYAKAFSPDELDEIEGIAQRYNVLPNTPPASEGGFFHMNNLTRGAAFGGGGAYMGGPAMGLAAGLSGLFLPAGIRVLKKTNAALSFPEGRKLVTDRLLTHPDVDTGTLGARLGYAGVGRGIDYLTQEDQEEEHRQVFSR
jgi:hypothetical protein